MAGRTSATDDGLTGLTAYDGRCPESSRGGAGFLWFVDIAFSGRSDIREVRYRDDVLFLSDRRWPVRRAQKQRNTFFDLTGCECHPDKAQHGKIAQGSDWPGVWFTDNGATGTAPRAQENHRLHRLRLFEQARRAGLSDAEIRDRVQLYDRRWLTWAESQLSACRLQK